MIRATKAAMTAATLPFAALPLMFLGPVPLAAATQVIPEGPATVLHHGPTPWAMDENLGGALCEQPKLCREVYYQWIVPLGLVEVGVAENVRALNSAIKRVSSDPEAPEDTIVYGFSGGARVASKWLQDHGSDHEESDATPSPDDLSFVLIGNGGRKYGGLNGWWYGDALLTPTDTDYAVVDIAREYDPIADFPKNPFNLLALANAIAAFDYIHMTYDEVDLDDPENIVWTEGNTTYVHVPTENLPLLQGFRNFGLGWLVDSWEEPLREIIDQAYDRTWLEGKPAQGEQGDPTLQAVLGDQEAPRSATSSLVDATEPVEDEADQDEAALDGAAEDEAAQDGAAEDESAPDSDSEESDSDSGSDGSDETAAEEPEETSGGEDTPVTGESGDEGDGDSGSDTAADSSGDESSA
ncbi:PE-PPE domain-containing protein [Mycolicibacterium vanbaalenii]|uniref:PE-PPE, C-terminal domain protein n=1 Tax=Mycolicibacterium vanbaalenii (strain DSM 7251 / JCM 13017 / BCRC 16820 / KCTC 9966 / NRRL B-24157 / PYR-1) TaxID=350058 RepID=A1T9Q4_MYCVP|nr:PE-PPE domain-containing protein [Mycolicibacterium vanbaalenii]ABM13904.1 PE-PPE, C-terminal domain protein [Mycolicibacterium vanbaalenii PYR-1]